MVVGGRVVELWDEVGPPDASETLLNMAPLLGLVPEEILSLGELLVLRLGAEYWLQRVGIVAGVPGLRSDGHRRGGEVLHLF